MHQSPTLLIISLFAAAACSPRTEAPRDPSRPTPVAGPDPTTATEPQGRPAPREVAGSGEQRVPTRPEQAPLVQIRDAIESDSLLGRRVRVAGRCTVGGQGRRAGSWKLQGADASIEVRGRVPPSCVAADGEPVIIFAQIEPKAAGSHDRILLRLPD